MTTATLTAEEMKSLDRITAQLKCYFDILKDPDGLTQQQHTYVCDKAYEWLGEFEGYFQRPGFVIPIRPEVPEEARQLFTELYKLACDVDVPAYVFGD